MDLQTMGKLVALLGGLMVIAGGLLWAFGRLGMGSLPGDLHLSGQGWSCYVPIATSILISLILTLLLNLVWRLFNR